MFSSAAQLRATSTPPTKSKGFNSPAPVVTATPRPAPTRTVPFHGYRTAANPVDPAKPTAAAQSDVAQPSSRQSRKMSGTAASSRKVSLNHLLNFTLPARQPAPSSNSVPSASASTSASAAARSRRDTNKTGGARARAGSTTSSSYALTPTQAKERFINANFMFLVRPHPSLAPALADPDVPVPWAAIDQVIMPVTPDAPPACPICLTGPPIAPRITKCGHVLCYPCLLQYHTLEPWDPYAAKQRSSSLTLGADVPVAPALGLAQRWRQCPICTDAIYEHDVKPVRLWTVPAVPVRNSNARSLGSDRTATTTPAVDAATVDRAIAALTRAAALVASAQDAASQQQQQQKKGATPHENEPEGARPPSPHRRKRHSGWRQQRDSTHAQHAPDRHDDRTLLAFDPEYARAAAGDALSVLDLVLVHRALGSVVVAPAAIRSVTATTTAPTLSSDTATMGMPSVDDGPTATAYSRIAASSPRYMAEEVWARDLAAVTAERDATRGMLGPLAARISPPPQQVPGAARAALPGGATWAGPRAGQSPSGARKQKSPPPPPPPAAAAPALNAAAVESLQQSLVFLEMAETGLKRAAAGASREAAAAAPNASPAPPMLQPLIGTNHSTGAHVYFYTAAAAHTLYLHPADLAILARVAGGYARLPARLLVSVVYVHQTTVDDDLRLQFASLAHLPLGCDVALAEIDLAAAADDIVAAQVPLSPHSEDEASLHDSARARADAVLADVAPELAVRSLARAARARREAQAAYSAHVATMRDPRRRPGSVIDASVWDPHGHHRGEYLGSDDDNARPHHGHGGDGEDDPDLQAALAASRALADAQAASRAKAGMHRSFAQAAASGAGSASEWRTNSAAHVSDASSTYAIDLRALGAELDALDQRHAAAAAAAASSAPGSRSSATSTKVTTVRRHSRVLSSDSGDVSDQSRHGDEDPGSDGFAEEAEMYAHPSAFSDGDDTEDHRYAVAAAYGYGDDEFAPTINGGGANGGSGSKAGGGGRKKRDKGKTISLTAGRRR
ncbi:hypothetical protein BC828DRAFT_386371 [Blastocladiella britannica]|nr:hypothetical protein BC828DRAFT_386371 [Blastocladiella britannica]